MYHLIMGHREVVLGLLGEDEIQAGIWKKNVTLGVAYRAQCGERGKAEIRIFWNQNPNKA